MKIFNLNEHGWNRPGRAASRARTPALERRDASPRESPWKTSAGRPRSGYKRV